MKEFYVGWSELVTRHSLLAWLLESFLTKVRTQQMYGQVSTEYGQTVPEIVAKVQKVLNMVRLAKWVTHDDLRLPSFATLFQELETAQAQFLAVQDQVRASSYRWPRRPLYEWSRRAEYPIVAHTLQQDGYRRVLDAGSGVTFFPFYLRRQYEVDVECLDVEPSFAYRMEQLLSLLDVGLSIPFHVADLCATLPLQAEAYDAVYSISVLEHLPSEARLFAIEQLWRLVRPGGGLLLTVDVTLNEEGEGIPLDMTDSFIRELSAIVGQLPLLDDKLPSNLLTPQRPGYKFAPLQVRGRIVSGKFKDRCRLALLHLSGFPSTFHPPLACIFVYAVKSHLCH